MLAYQNLCTVFYDTDKPQAPPDELAFYARFAREADGPIFEPMCGSGRFLIALHQMGFDIDGADASSVMLEACRAKVAALPASSARRPTLVRQWLHETDMPRQYALILVTSGSITLVADDSQFHESLARLHGRLRPGGKLVMNFSRNLATAPYAYPWTICKRVTKADGSTILLSSAGSFDAATRMGRDVHRYEHIVDGRLVTTELEDFHVCSREPDDYRRALAAAGFAEIRFWNEFTFEPAKEGDLEQTVECVRH
jgi:SAM-dependent methyltransferase